MKWWLRMLPLQAVENSSTSIDYHGARRLIASSYGPDPAVEDRVMLLRPRKSRIYYLRRFFDYPVTLSLATLRKLGLWRTIKIGMGFLRSALLPLREERTLEHFFINRFGRELYSTFFKAYTEKVWGVPCSEISAEWGAQRVKGLSLWATLLHALRKAFGRSRRNVAQKNTQTSLIEQFLYPKFGPGQMWEEVARQVIAMGGEIHTGCTVNRVITDGWRVCAVEAANSATGAIGSFA
jgi:protoporphyrinogen oxidase